MWYSSKKLRMGEEMEKKKIVKNILLMIVMIVCIGFPKSIFADTRCIIDPYIKESKKYSYNYEDPAEINKGQEIYNVIYKALVNLDDSVDLSKYGPPKTSDVFDIRKKVLDDHPEIFYFTHQDSVYWTNGKLDFKYIASKDVVKNMKNELDNKANNIIKTQISNSMNNMDKVIAIHDYLVLNTTYDLNAEYAFDPYGVIVKGSGVCQGYTTSMKLLLNKVGIDSVYLSSQAMNHIWNIVNIDGENYQMDSTWDDPVPNREGVVRYKYLALSDDEMRKDHNWEDKTAPKCTSTKYHYMREMDYVVNYKDYRYYTNVSDGDRVYKIKKDGSDKQKIVNSPGTPLYVKDGYLYYKDLRNGDIKKLQIEEQSKGEVNKGEQNKKIFNDVKGHWAADKIDLFTQKGYINGYEDNSFRPDNSITRAEFVKIVNKYFGLTKKSGKVFNDTAYHWAKDEIDIAVTNGVCKGMSNEEFSPDKPITREQASLMISNYKKIADNNYNKINRFTDKLEVSDWAKSGVEGILKNGYMNGYPDNTFKPQSNITRAEAVVTLSRVK
ncbi:S-layer homology domain-containing protein [Paraclostridium sordellii]|uniref:Exported protein n=2 Tax=Paraclostridium sordellii TaxID=1505 RepID=A0A0C7QVU9_PARSO|nr:S-layer homology domain-containing protein [Paeniclostridium sordellii]CEN79757.1 exported protein [[Clostridium] sordellii] [Paeniclostridium sordellii]CEO12260.1 exported protein [[Clostridium] sordellii] [Paeniclostridium sordellii]CEP87804.1 exported protein [[Clostridium] sordellii] [Paeniclostridium sordellii]CEP97460.1 exported protein [[Clostridium] sordellii] [Paeniclostridium sordellii]CEQ01148.1 exported protein [[Clostridium] sordellii] [Paeniclostridium sordellii]